MISPVIPPVTPAPQHENCWLCHKDKPVAVRIDGDKACVHRKSDGNLIPDGSVLCTECADYMNSARCTSCGDDTAIVRYHDERVGKIFASVYAYEHADRGVVTSLCFHCAHPTHCCSGCEEELPIVWRHPRPSASPAPAEAVLLMQGDGFPSEGHAWDWGTMLCEGCVAASEAICHPGDRNLMWRTAYADMLATSDWRRRPDEEEFMGVIRCRENEVERARLMAIPFQYGPHDEDEEEGDGDEEADVAEDNGDDAHSEPSDDPADDPLN